MKDYSGLLFFAFLISLFLAIFIISRRRERKRTEGFREFAESLGFEFFHTSDEFTVSRLEAFYLGSQGRRRSISNGMRGTTHDLDVSIFDYTFTVGSGKNSRVYNTSVVLFQAESIKLPDFCLRPEGFWNRVGASLFGMQDIDFDTHPTFSKKYLLKGSDEEAVREALTSDTLDYFEAIHGLSVEARSGRFIFYRHGTRIDPAKLRDFLDQGFEVLGLFQRT